MVQPIQVLLVDDDEELRDLLRIFFRQHGIEFSVLHSANHLRQRLDKERPSLLVLDLMLPGTDGLSALKQLRSDGDNLPVILLSARDEAIDRIMGLEAGADDYVGKPFMPQELLARIHAVLRRHHQFTENTQPIISFGPYQLDTQQKCLFRDSELLKLPAYEYRMLEVLARNLNQCVSRKKLIDDIYGFYADVTERGIDVPIWRIRQIIEPNPSAPVYLKTVRGIGYLLQGDA
ncbi:response regulator [Celerinatantimonas sp. MCCC 1A17872]|uniref:response regulator n=1 Tax=Celerinatantimonas sp. MCCC 1A17872 TaxID=3177514 RepID=UPI0038C38EDB